MSISSHRNAAGEWVYPQIYYRGGKRISKQRLVEQIQANLLVQESMQLEPCVRDLIEQAKKQRCVQGYNRIMLFYDYYKPKIAALVGWKAQKDDLRTMQHYDAIYRAIDDLLPADDVDLYPEGIMSNGMYSPNLQEKYGREYP